MSRALITLPTHTPRPAAAARPRRRWPLVMLILLLASAWATLTLYQALGEVGPLPFSVDVNGHDLTAMLQFGQADTGARLALACGLTLAGLILAIILPMTVLLLVGMLLALVAVTVLTSVGLPLLVVGGVLALLCAPLLLLGWLLHKLVR